MLIVIENPYTTPEFSKLDRDEIQTILEQHQDFREAYKEIRELYGLSRRQLYVITSFHAGKRHYKWDGNSVSPLKIGGTLNVHDGFEVVQGKIKSFGRFTMHLTISGEDIEFDLGTLESLEGYEVVNNV